MLQKEWINQKVKELDTEIKLWKSIPGTEGNFQLQDFHARLVNISNSLSFLVNECAKRVDGYGKGLLPILTKHWQECQSLLQFSNALLATYMDAKAQESGRTVALEQEVNNLRKHYREALEAEEQKRKTWSWFSDRGKNPVDGLPHDMGSRG